MISIPRDGVESAQAHRIAQLYLQEHRMDRWEAAGFNATARGTRLAQLLVAHNYQYELIDHIATWNAARQRDAEAVGVVEPDEMMAQTSGPGS